MIPVRAIVRGALARFLAASVTVLAALAIPLVLFADHGIRAVQLLLLAGESGAAAMGFGAVLFLLRRALHPQADVAGRRSVVAGACFPIGLMVASMKIQVLGLPAIAGLSAGVGGLFALGMYWPWLNRFMPPDSRDASALDEAPEPNTLATPIARDLNLETGERGFARRSRPDPSAAAGPGDA